MTVSPSVSSNSLMTLLSAYGISLLLTVVPILILCIVAWCRIFRNVGISPGILFIPVYGAYRAYSVARSGGLFIATLIMSGVVTALNMLIREESVIWQTLLKDKV